MSGGWDLLIANTYSEGVLFIFKINYPTTTTNLSCADPSSSPRQGPGVSILLFECRLIWDKYTY